MLNLNNLNNVNSLGGNSGTPWYKASSLSLAGVLPSFVHQYNYNRYYDSVNGQTAFPFSATRTTNATMFDSSGNLVWAPANLYSFSDIGSTGWTLSSATCAVDSGVTSPTATNVRKLIGGNGITLNANDSIGGVIAPTLTVVANATYAISFYAKAAELSLLRVREPTVSGTRATIDLTTGVVVFESGSSALNQLVITASSVGNGWWRVLCRRTASGTTQGFNIKPGSTTGDGVSGIYVTSAQFELDDVSSPKTYVPTAGAAYYGPRFDTEPSTLQPKGILIEGVATNSLSNSSMVGGVAPSTAPTNWFATTVAGITTTYAYGTENGFSYMDITYSGTNTSGAAAFPTIYLGSLSSTIAALNTEVWTGSAYIRKVAGADNINLYTLALRARDAATALIGGQTSSTTLSGGASLNVARHSTQFTFSSASVAWTELTLMRTLGIGEAVDITLRIAAPQFEKSSSSGYLTSYIPTYGTATTRGADTLSASTGAWLTSGSGTLYTEVTYQYMNTYLFPSILQIDDNSGINRIQIFSQSGVGNTNVGARVDDAGVVQVNTGVVNTATFGTLNKYVFSYELNNSRMVFNGGTLVSDLACTIPATLTIYRPGGTTVATSGSRWIKTLRYYPTTAASTAQLQAITA